MNSVRDTALKRWVAPFGNSGINDRSHLPRTYRSVPRPSSPLDAKAFTRCPSLPHHHPTPATGPDAFPGGLSAFGLLEPGLHRTRPCLRPVPPRNIQTLRSCRAPPAPWREHQQVSPQTLSIPCVPIRTTGQHLLLPKKQTILPDRPAVTQSRKTPYDDKQHSRPRPTPGGKPSSQEQACTRSRSVEHFIPEHLMTSPPPPTGGSGGPGPIRTADLTLIRGAL